MCRICYCSEKELDSPLIRPCHCAGTMKYIHFCCLQKWLKSKITVKSSSNESTIAISFKLVECELCKTLLPDCVKYKNNLYQIWDFTKPKFKEYISFETVTGDKNNRTMYIVNLENKQTIKIGRGHESDVRITDISVSRFHSLIKKNPEGKLIIEDNNSKFGTLTLVQNPKLNILNHSPLSIQIGRTILNFTLKPPCGFFRCFSKKSSKNKTLDYQILNNKFVNKENFNNIKIQNETEESDYYSITEHLETEKDKENKYGKNMQDENVSSNEDKNIQANAEALEQQGNIINNHEQFYDLAYFNNNLIIDSNNINNLEIHEFNRNMTNAEGGYRNNEIQENSNIIIVEKDDSKEEGIVRESSFMNRINDLNIKTERDLCANQNIESEETRRNNRIIDDVDYIKQNVSNIPKEKEKKPINDKEKIKSKIDQKILDLKLINLTMKNKLDAVNLGKKLKENTYNKANQQDSANDLKNNIQEDKQKFNDLNDKDFNRNKCYEESKAQVSDKDNNEQDNNKDCFPNSKLQVDNSRSNEINILIGENHNSLQMLENDINKEIDNSSADNPNNLIENLEPIFSGTKKINVEDFDPTSNRNSGNIHNFENFQTNNEHQPSRNSINMKNIHERESVIENDNSSLPSNNINNTQSNREKQINYLENLNKFKSYNNNSHRLSKIFNIISDNNAETNSNNINKYHTIKFAKFSVSENMQMLNKNFVEPKVTQDNIRPLSSDNIAIEVVNKKINFDDSNISNSQNFKENRRNSRKFLLENFENYNSINSNNPNILNNERINYEEIEIKQLNNSCKRGNNNDSTEFKQNKKNLNKDRIRPKLQRTYLSSNHKKTHIKKPYLEDIKFNPISNRGIKLNNINSNNSDDELFDLKNNHHGFTNENNDNKIYLNDNDLKYSAGDKDQI